jgi:predicted O-linked N-acetylglucosamine transferase (SPINDLY family)
MSRFTVQQAFDQALQHHQAGRLPEAQILYHQILSHQPQHIDALHFLGVSACQAGDDERAVHLIRQAISLRPHYIEAHNNLGSILHKQRKLDEAIAAFRQAIRLKPDYAKAYYNLANALKDKGEIDPAIESFERAISLKAGYVEAIYDLGNLLQAKKRYREAAEAFRQVIASKPNYAEAFSNLGNALLGAGQLKEAIQAYSEAIVLNPNQATPHVNLGNALNEIGQCDQAVAAHRRAIAIDPNCADAYINLGNSLRAEGLVDEAIAALRTAVKLRPATPQAFNNLGNALKDQGNLDEAMTAYRQAITIQPDCTAAWSNLLITMLYHMNFDAAAIQREINRWNQQQIEPLRKLIQPNRNDRDPNRRLRIGYVSADFCAHASVYFLTPVLEHHDPRAVELFCYAEVTCPDAFTHRLQHVAHWRSTVGMSDDEVAHMVRDDAIDILVDLKLHCANNRLLTFARKPAPVQATWLGYPGTTGLKAIDYRLSDPHLDPAGADESIYCEKTIRLDKSFWCIDPLDGREIAVGPLPAATTPDGAITFGCLNTFCKINEPLLALWARVLKEAPNSRLLLMAPPGSARQWALECLSHGGIDAGRIEFVPRQTHVSYLELYRKIDICLDTYPYNGHTTTLDTLWMGVPVVTLCGEPIVSRGGKSILTNVGLPELIAESPDAFVRIAVDLSRDLNRLKTLRAELRNRMLASPVMDARGFSRNLEAVYRTIWQRWCDRSTVDGANQ